MQQDILKRTLAMARATWRTGDRDGWSDRVTRGLRLEAERRHAVRSISRRGARASVPMSDRLAQRFPG